MLRISNSYDMHGLTMPVLGPCTYLGWSFSSPFTLIYSYFLSFIQRHVCLLIKAQNTQNNTKLKKFMQEDKPSECNYHIKILYIMHSLAIHFCYQYGRNMASFTCFNTCNLWPKVDFESCLFSLELTSLTEVIWLLDLCHQRYWGHCIF